MSLFDALSVSAFAIAFVFTILIIISIIISLLKYLPTQKPQTSKANEIVSVPQASPFKIEDITDEDMMVAALIATIECSKDTNQNIKLKSIKQVG